MRTSRFAAALATGALVLTACQPAQQAAPTSAPAAPTTAAAAKPTTAASPSASPVAGTAPVAAGAAPQAGCPNQPGAAGAKKLKVGLVTDVGRVDDKSFNQSAWEGVQCAATNLSADVKFIETSDPKD